MSLQKVSSQISANQQRSSSDSLPDLTDANLDSNINSDDEAMVAEHGGSRFNDEVTPKNALDTSSIDTETDAELENHQDPIPLIGKDVKHARKLSTTSSSSVKSNKVPLKKRRGALAQVCLIPEYTDARDYPASVKYCIIFIIGMAAVIGPMGTSIMLPALDEVAADLDTTASIVNVSVGVYLLSLGIFPLWWSAFSERHGRRSVYLISFALLCGFSVGTALAPSIGTLILFRVLCGSCSASVQAVGAGTVADLYIQEERGAAMGIYYLGPLCGPLLAPVIGGAVAEKWGWRGTQWFLVIFAGVDVLMILFALPETLRKQDNAQAIRSLLKEKMKNELVESDEEINLQNEKESGAPKYDRTSQQDEHLDERDIMRAISELSRHSSRMEAEDFDPPVADSFMPSASRITTNKDQLNKIQQNDLSKIQQSMNRLEDASRRNSVSSSTKAKRSKRWIIYRHNLYIYLLQPLKALHLLRYPPVLFALLYSSPCFAVLYFVNMTISYEYSRSPYNFHSVILGLVYLPNSVTYLIASIYGGKWTDYLLKKNAAKNNGKLHPESRISYNVVVAIMIFPIALLIIGWCLDKKEHWVTPLVGTSLFGFASMIVIGTTVTYIVDSLPGRSATGVALNNLVRMILAAIATFITEPLLRAIGPGVLFSILAGVISVAATSLIILKSRSKKWRTKYDLTDLYDKLD